MAQQSRGVSGFCRAERRLEANPTNLIRVMPAEGDEMQHSDAIVRADLPQIAAAFTRADLKSAKGI
jgi:hypothetical protein